MLRFSVNAPPDIAGLCVRPLCFAAVGDEFYGIPTLQQLLGEEAAPSLHRFGLQGSCTLIEYRGVCTFVFTKHQIAHIPNETAKSFIARMELLHPLIDDGRNGYNLPYRWVLAGHGEDDLGDFVIAITERSMLTDYMLSCFFPVERGSKGWVGDEAMAAGYPHHLQSLLMETDGNRTVPFPISGQIVSRTDGATAHFTSSDTATSLDGMSGGPVFVVRLISREQAASFIDGIVQRGGNGNVRYLTIERVLDRIDVFLDT